MSRHSVVSKVKKDGNECQSHLPPCDSRNQGSITTTAQTAQHAADGSAKQERRHFRLNHVTRSAWDFVFQLCSCGLVCGICTWPQRQGISTFLLPIPHIQEAIAACSSLKPSYRHWCGWGGRRGPEFLKWFTPFLDALPFTGWCSNYEIKVISKIVIGRDMEVPELRSELKRALINQSYSSPLMWLEDIPEAAIWAASVPHPNIPFGSLVLLSLPLLPSI